MRLTEFKRRVRQAFGENLENATPANVREFLDGLQQEIWKERKAEQRIVQQRPDPVYELPASDGPISWETLVREFFLQALEVEEEQAVMMLWIFAMDLAYSGIEELHSDKMNRLFSDKQG